MADSPTSEPTPATHLVTGLSQWIRLPLLGACGCGSGCGCGCQSGAPCQCGG